MVIKSAVLDIVCGITSKIPDTGLPEVAFAGKSNVGKSSLINGLMNRKALARTSAQPGKTQTINFYKINDELDLVDLPGYGYAKTARAEQERFSKVIDYYLTHRQGIRYVFLLVDIRHEPGTLDLTMLEWMRYHGYRPVIIATKADKLSKAQQQKQLAVLRRSMSLTSEDRIIPFSALSKQGRDEIWELLEEE